MEDRIELVIDYPANVAAFLINDQIDAGLVPVAIIPLLKEHYVIADYGIACDGEVASVCLFSDVPLAAIKSIYLDYQSRTSVELLKILFAFKPCSGRVVQQNIHANYPRKLFNF